MLEATEAEYIQEDAILTHRGAMHYKLRGTNATSDAFYLMLYYGLLQCKKDAIKEIRPKSVRTLKGEEIPTDIILKCVGCEPSDEILSDSLLLHSHFIDGRRNMTAFFGWDRCLKPHMLYGPYAEQNTLNPFSIIHLVEQLAEIDAYFLIHPQEFERFIHKAKRGTNPPVYPPEIIDLETNFTFFNYCLSDGPVELLRRIFAYTSEREAIYEKHLPHQNFLEANQTEWDDYAKKFAKMTGRAQLKYPYENHHNENR